MIVSFNSLCWGWIGLELGVDNALHWGGAVI